MKNLLLITTVASGLLGAVLGAPSLLGAQSAPLSRVFEPADDQPAAANAAQAPDQRTSADALDAWRTRLTERDLALRERHFEQLIADARKDVELRAALEDWAADDAAGELAWTARLALRELEASPLGWLGARGMPQDASGFEFDAPFDPRAWIEALEQRHGALGLGLGQPISPLTPGSTTSESAESFSLSVGPDGVKCEVTRKVDGHEETQEYTAESIDALLDAHPQLRDKLRVGGLSLGADLHGQLDLGQNLEALQRGFSLRLGPRRRAQGWIDPLRNSEVRTDILGVVVEPLASGEKAGDAPAGVGVRIERVEPDTIAGSMGLQRGQVLIELNGAPIKSRDDITAEIVKRAADGALEAVVIDRWGQRRTHTWKPDTARRL